MRTRLRAPLAVILVLVPSVEVCHAETLSGARSFGAAPTSRNAVLNDEFAGQHQHYGVINVLKAARLRARQAATRGGAPPGAMPNPDR